MANKFNIELLLSLNSDHIILILQKDKQALAKKLIRAKTENLLLAVDKLLKKCDLQVRQLHSIKVGELNGTFSQVRGVLTLVNTLSLALDIPLWRGAKKYKLLVPEYTHEPHIGMKHEA